MFRKKTEPDLNHISFEVPDEDGDVRTVCGLIKPARYAPDWDLNTCTECFQAIRKEYDLLMHEVKILTQIFNQVAAAMSKGAEEHKEFCEVAGFILKEDTPEASVETEFDPH